MSNSTFIKKLTAAEVGNTKTHEIYIRIPNDFDFESFFNNTHVENGSVIEVAFNAEVSSFKETSLKSTSYELRFVYFANSNKEKRIPGLGSLFKSFNVTEGDIACLQKIESGGLTSYKLSFLPASFMQVFNGGLQTFGELDTSKNYLYAPSGLPLQKIFYGAPGTGKSFTIDNIVDDDNSIRTTFHPDTDYASFIGAYKPTMESVPMSYVSEGKAKYAQPFGEHTGKERKIVYKYVPQAFLKAYTAAWKNYMSGKPYFLVIEEINRGNCAQIFGDLFQLLDRNNSGSSSYPISADEDIRQYLNNFFAKTVSDTNDKYLTNEERDAIRDFVFVKDNGKHVNVGEQILNGSKLILPPNLHIWATMNTSDQSLFPIDSAFKRRWDWEYMPIVYNPTDKCTGQPIEWRFCIGDKLYSWGDFLKKINPEIYVLTESSDKQMGYFFAKADPKTDIISENVFLNKVLFYLWTDVFKDYAIDSKAFQSEDLKRPFRFTDFFENSANILALLKNLEVESIEDRNGIAEYNSDDDSDDDSGRDYTKYRINGTGRYSKKNLAAELVRRYIDANPEKSAFEVVKEWKTLGNIVTHFIELQEEFVTRTDKTPRVEKLECNGENIYVSTNGWGGTDKIKQLKQAVESKDWGLTITEYPNETTD